MRIPKISKPSGEKTGSFNLRRILLPVLTIAALTGILAYMWTLDLDSLTREATETSDVKQQQTLKSLANTLGNNLEKMIGHVRTMAQDEAIITTIKSAPYTKLPVYSAIPSGSVIRLIAKDAVQLHQDESMPFSYACLDLVNRTLDLKKQGILPLEMHLSGTDRQHVAIVAPVRNGDNSLIGVVEVSLPTSWLREQVAALAVQQGYIELQQGSRNLLASKGDNTQRIGKPLTRKVPHSIFNLAYWPKQTQWQDALNMARLQFGIIAAAVILVLLIAGYLRFRWRKELGAIRISLPRRQKKKSASEAVAADEPVHEEVKEKEELAGPGADSIFLDPNSMIVEDADEAEAFKDLAPATEPEQPEPGSTTDEVSGESMLIEDEETDMTAQETPSDNLQAGPAPAVEIPVSIFKAYDIRGVVTDTLTAKVVYEIGRAFGSEMAERSLDTVVVGRDGRLSGDELIAALKQGLSDTGRRVVDVGMVPTPVLYYATHELKTGTGIMLTGSHNPPEYNGLKMMMGDETLSSDTIQALLQRLQSGKLYQGKGSIEEQNVLPSYLKRISNEILLLKKFKIVIDCGNGVAGVIAPQLFRELGCEVIELYTKVDGTFPNHHPDPSQPKNLQDVIARVAEENADMGFAFDGDGDRLGVVTAQGKVIFPDRLMMLFAEDILSRNPGAEIIYDVKCSKNLGDAIRKFGGKATMWKTGHSLIKKQMKESGALLAGEMSGHIFFKERWYGFDDAFYSGARLLEVMVLKASDRSVSEVFDALPDSINTPELNIKMQEGETHAFMEELAAKAKFENANVITIDGLRVELDDAWGLIRASNTTPVLVLRFEADNEAALQRIQDMFRKQILALKPDMELPF